MGEVHTATVRALRILTDAIDNHRTNVWGNYQVDHDEDVDLYAALDKAKSILAEVVQDGEDDNHTKKEDANG